MPNTERKTLKKHLQSFNRKERFHLVGQMLGNKDFKLGKGVLKSIIEDIGAQKFKLNDYGNPKNFFAAMDYHLDWIYASLILYSETNEQKTRSKERDCIKCTQEDIDFLISFTDNDNTTHIILIEAKGDSTFTNKQLESKKNRLNAIFGNKGKKWDKIKPHFILCSKKKPSYRINKANSPFGKGHFLWFKIEMPNDLYKVTSCEDNGIQSQKGSCWKVETTRFNGDEN